MSYQLSMREQRSERLMNTEMDSNPVDRNLLEEFSGWDTELMEAVRRDLVSRRQGWDNELMEMLANSALVKRTGLSICRWGLM